MLFGCHRSSWTVRLICSPGKHNFFVISLNGRIRYLSFYPKFPSISHNSTGICVADICRGKVNDVTPVMPFLTWRYSNIYIRSTTLNSRNSMFDVQLYLHQRSGSKDKVRRWRCISLERKDQWPGVEIWVMFYKRCAIANSLSTPFRCAEE